MTNLNNKQKIVVQIIKEIVLDTYNDKREYKKNYWKENSNRYFTLKHNCVVCNITYFTRSFNTKSRYCSFICRSVDIQGDKVWNYKGDDVSYVNLHKWVSRKLGKPDKCSKCKKSGLSRHMIHWANISRQYHRKLNDWIRLCAKCHKTFDMKYKQSIA